ncbi:MAG: hypothetical protein ABJQ39_02800 [Winogradskyella arenosi]
MSQYSIDNNLKNIVLVLTATVEPNSRDTLVVIDPEERKKQYLEALKFYINDTKFKIVFVENSGNSLASQFHNDEGRIEFITFNSEPSYPDKGKGVKEYEIIEYALMHSKFIKHSDYFIKITGRLKVLNIKGIVNNFYDNKGCVSPKIGCNWYKKNKMDSRCFIIEENAWKVFRKYGEKLSLKYSFEEALWDTVKSINSVNTKLYANFKYPLRIEGISGGFGNAYNHSLTYYILKRIKLLLIGQKMHNFLKES